MLKALAAHPLIVFVRGQDYMHERRDVRQPLNWMRPLSAFLLGWLHLRVAVGKSDLHLQVPASWAGLRAQNLRLRASPSAAG